MEKIKSWAILALFIATCVFATLWIVNRSENREIAGDAIKSDIVTVPITHRYKDTAGRNHVVIDSKANEEIVSATNKIAEPIARIVDSIAKSYNLKPKQVEGYTGVEFSVVRDSLRFMTKSYDSLKRLTRTYKDKYLSLVVRDPVYTDTSDNGVFDFGYNADLSFVDYSKRRKLLGFSVGKKDFFTDISSSDPRLTIKGVRKLTIKRQVPPFGIRLQAQTSYGFLSKEYSAGLGLRLDIGNFNAGVNYNYNFIQGKWIPSIYTKYDLVQLGR